MRMLKSDRNRKMIVGRLRREGPPDTVHTAQSQPVLRHPAPKEHRASKRQTTTASTEQPRPRWRTPAGIKLVDIDRLARLVKRLFCTQSLMATIAPLARMPSEGNLIHWQKRFDVKRRSITGTAALRLRRVLIKQLQSDDTSSN